MTPFALSHLLSYPNIHRRTPPFQQLNVMIEHAYYPHIVEAIFDYAGFDSLVAMSQTCQDWRHRASAKIGHIYHFDGESFYHPFDTTKENIVRQCRILDVAFHPTSLSSGFDAEAQQFGHARLPSYALNLDTIRFVDVGYLQTPIWYAAARRLVFGQFHCNWNPRFLQDKDFTGRALFIGVKRVIINHTLRTSRCHQLEPRSFFMTLREVVFVFHGHEACPCCFLSVLRSARRTHVPVTVVGAETLTTHATFQPYRVEGQKFTKPSGDRRLAVRGIRLLTHEEYRELIGEKEYAIETDFKMPERVNRYSTPSLYDPIS